MNHSSQVGAERAPSSRNASAAIQTEQLTPSELASHDAVTLGDTDVHSTHKEREQDGETAEQAAEADNEEEENGDDDDGADGDDDEGYAAEYRSLLFRVADGATGGSAALARGAAAAGVSSHTSLAESVNRRRHSDREQLRQNGCTG